MTLYSIHPSKNYLASIADFLSRNHADQIENTTIYLPTKRACRSIKAELQKYFPKKNFDKILPLGEFEDFESMDNESGVIPKIEQQKVITEIIYDYKELDFTIYQAANLANSLISLFSQIDSDGVNIEKLSELSIDDSSEHWLKLRGFLQYSYNKFKEYLKSTNQIDYASSRNSLIKSYIDSLLNTPPKAPIVIAGSSGSIKAVADLIKVISSFDNCYAILPAIDLKDINHFGHILKLLDYCLVKKENLKEIDSDIFIENNHQYFETSNKLSEVKLIVDLIRKASNADPLKKIALVTHNENLVQNISYHLKDLDIDNAFGSEIKNTESSSFIRLLAKTILSDFLIIDLIALLKHKFLISDHVFKIEKAILRGSEVVEGYDDLKYKAKKIDDSNAQNYFLNFLNSLQNAVRISSSNFLDFALFTEELLKIYSNLDISKSAGDEESISFFTDFIKYHNNYLKPRESFLFLLDVYLSGARYYKKFGWESKIFAINPIEMRMLHFDVIIAADLNEGSWPKDIKTDPWMNMKMREEVGLSSIYENISKSYHDFYLISYMNLIITRSKKLDGANSTISRFITTLIPNLKLSEYSFAEEDKIHPKESVPPIALSHHKPKILAVTHIEMLIRNPYAFYARKILALYPLDDIMKQADFADFGNFIHEAFEEYSLSNGDIEKIGRRILDKSNYSDFTINLWWPKFLNISKEFVVFEDSKIKQLEQIYTEIEGRWEVEIDEHRLIISAKADRIEITNDKKVNIIDYKTGVVPTKKDVMLGLSPQLLIESMIVKNLGFKEFTCQEIGGIVYIKISSSKPYIQEIYIDINNEIIEKSTEGLIKLLRFYLDKSFIFYDSPNKYYAPKYNDYKSLAKN